MLAKRTLESLTHAVGRGVHGRQKVGERQPDGPKVKTVEHLLAVY